MARDLRSKCEKCRRAGEKLFLKGDRCASPKCAMVRKPYAPGMHGQKGSRGQSEFGKQLAMKQRAKRIYGINERQFRKYFEDVKKKKGVTSDLLLERLEMRLDNAAYRSGFAVSRSQARQLVRHGFFVVNGKKMNIPSYKVKTGDVISVNPVKKEKEYLKSQLVLLKNKKDFPSWLSFDKDNLAVKITGLPRREEIGGEIDPKLIIEFYSR